MNIELIFKMLTPQQVVALLVRNKIVDPQMVAQVENKGDGLYSYCVYEGPSLIRKYLVQIKPEKISLMGSYLWRGDVA